MADEEIVNTRALAQQARAARVRELRQIPRVRVLPRDDEVRRTIAHYPTGIGFPPEGGSVEWPNDSFTKKLVRDGAVTIDLQTGEERDARKEAEAAPLRTTRQSQS